MKIRKWKYRNKILTKTVLVNTIRSNAYTHGSNWTQTFWRAVFTIILSYLPHSRVRMSDLHHHRECRHWDLKHRLVDFIHMHDPCLHCSLILIKDPGTRFNRPVNTFQHLLVIASETGVLLTIICSLAIKHVWTWQVLHPNHKRLIVNTTRQPIWLLLSDISHFYGERWHKEYENSTEHLHQS